MGLNLISLPYHRFANAFICNTWVKEVNIGASGVTNHFLWHYSDVIMGMMASQITSLTIIYSTVYSGADQRKHQSSASLAFVRRIYRWPMNSPHKRPVTPKMLPLDDVIMVSANGCSIRQNHSNSFEPVLANLFLTVQYCYSLKHAD